jgi:hypothetical protein
MAEDVFGHPLEDLDDAPVDPDPSEDTSATTSDADQLSADGTPPADPVEAKKYWQAAYTRSRQKDRERYGELEKQHAQYRDVLANFYRDDQYALRVLAERFPQLTQVLGQLGTSPRGTPSASPTGITQQLQQSLGDFSFLADKLGPALEQVIEQRVQAQLLPLQRNLTLQQEHATRAETDRLLADMDAKYPGWEEKYGTKMKALDEFLNSESLTHAEFGHKYELLYRLLNPDASRISASRTMLDAARRRSGTSQGSGPGVPNVDDRVRKAETRQDAFKLAAKAALESLASHE